MKRLICLMAVWILTLPCSASNYRGMFEIGAGPVFANERIRTLSGEFTNKETSFGGIFSTAHGCQFTPWLFAGAGAGVILERTNANKIESDKPDDFRTAKRNLISIPLFLDLRWDLDVNRKITPYADLRMGYQLGMEGYILYTATSVNNPSQMAAGWMKSADGMFVQATAGVKWKVKPSTGINFGISFIPLLKRSVKLDGELPCNRNFLLVNVGIDIQGTGKSTMKEDRKQRLYRLQQRKLKQQSKKFDFQ